MTEWAEIIACGQPPSWAEEQICWEQLEAEGHWFGSSCSGTSGTLSRLLQATCSSIPSREGSGEVRRRNEREVWEGEREGEGGRRGLWRGGKKAIHVEGRGAWEGGKSLCAGMGCVWRPLLCLLQRLSSFLLGVLLCIPCRSIDRIFCTEKNEFLCSIYILAVPG